MDYPILISISFIIFIWLRTNAMYDFLGKLPIFYFQNYSNEPQTVKDNLNYPLWLYFNHTNMFTKLISCPLCLSFWCNLIFAKSWQEWFSGAFVSLLAFCVLEKVYKHQ